LGKNKLFDVKQLTFKHLHFKNNLVTSLFYSAAKSGSNPQNTKLYAWIGFSGHRQPTSDIHWDWTDGFPTSFTQWASGEPNVQVIQSDPAKSCVYIDNMQGWHVDAKCNAALPFVCKTNLVDQEPITNDER